MSLLLREREKKMSNFTRIVKTGKILKISCVRYVSSSFRIKLFQGQTVDLNFLTLGKVGSRALSSGDLVTWARCCKRTCNARPIYSSSYYCQTVGGLVDTTPADAMLPKAAIVTLKGLLAWLDFISAYPENCTHS